MLRIATYNLRNTTDQYHKRRTELKNTIQNLNADVIGLQEVAYDELKYLTDGKYQIFLAPIQLPFPTPDPEFRIDGNAIIVRNGLQVDSHEIKHLSIFRNVAKITIDGILILNTHLHHVIGEDIVRYHQIQCTLAWLIPNLTDKIVYIGDFNMTPKSKEYEYTNQYFKSAHQTVHGQEPIKTFPSGLTGPFMDTDPEGTFDYVFTRNIEAISCDVFGQQNIEEGVYPSDHYGIIAEILL